MFKRKLIAQMYLVFSIAINYRKNLIYIIITLLPTRRQQESPSTTTAMTACAVSDSI